MAPKQENKKKENQTDNKKKGKGGKDKKIIKKRCGPPMATGTVMAQRVLPSMVCCPPSGCSTRGCLPSPGCGGC